MKRKIIEIIEEKCDGCGLCVPNCHEGALAIIGGKVKLVKESYCDGLGNCLGHCPRDAIKIVEKEVEEFDFEETNKHLKEMGREELKENPLKEDLACGCPGTMMREIKKESLGGCPGTSVKESDKQESELRQWPVQLNLLPPNAPFFQNVDLLVSADCVGFAEPNLHKKLMKGKAIGIGCPKLDDLQEYKEKIKAIIINNQLKSITVAIMEVPCCTGLYTLVEEALLETGKDILLEKVVVKIQN